MGIRKKIKHIIHVFNPCAGKGKASKLKKKYEEEGCAYMFEDERDTSVFIQEECHKDPDTCFTVYGGDGTVFKAVNALMDSGCNNSASMKIVPMGSGNDFVRSFEGQEGEMQIDVMGFNNRYAANVVNMGFDCSVVQRAQKHKKNPLVSGKMAYIFGVVGELIHKKAMDARVTLTYADGTQETLPENKFLFVAVANGAWYGGGFKVAPLAKQDDGLLDVMIVKDIKRRTFISLVSCFKKGTHVDPNTGHLIDKLKDIAYYKKCVAVSVVGCESVCADGEIFKESEVNVRIIPSAINYIVEKDVKEARKKQRKKSKKEAVTC